jgi:hypothetical protein
MNHTILELVISSFVIIIITTINTCQDLSKIQSPISLSTGSFCIVFQDISYHYDITGSAKKEHQQPFVQRKCLSALSASCFFSGLVALQIGWPGGLRGTEG